MVNNPEENIKLGDKDTLAIEEAQKRLLNIETLVSISNKNLKAIKVDTENLTKEKIGQETTLSNLIAKNKELSDLITSLEATKEAKAKEISDANDELAKIKSESDSIIAGHTEREKAVSSKEQELVSRETQISLKEQEIESAKQVLASKHQAIKELASKI